MENKGSMKQRKVRMRNSSPVPQASLHTSSATRMETKAVSPKGKISKPFTHFARIKRLVNWRFVQPSNSWLENKWVYSHNTILQDGFLHPRFHTFFKLQEKHGFDCYCMSFEKEFAFSAVFQLYDCMSSDGRREEITHKKRIRRRLSFSRRRRLVIVCRSKACSYNFRR